jgi:hypothetical protein
MTSTDLFQRRVNECRRLAAAARNGGDKAFWLGLVERWRVLESRNARRGWPRQTGYQQKHSPGRGGKAAGSARDSL